MKNKVPKLHLAEQICSDIVFFYNYLHNSVTVKNRGSANNTDKKEVIDLTEKTGYMPGVVVGLLVGAAIFLSIAFLTAKW